MPRSPPFSGILHARPHSWQSSRAKLVGKVGRRIAAQYRALCRPFMRARVTRVCVCAVADRSRSPSPSSYLTAVTFAAKLRCFVASRRSTSFAMKITAGLIVACIVTRSSSLLSFLFSLPHVTSHRTRPVPPLSLLSYWWQ